MKRGVFYVNVGNLPKDKAQNYVTEVRKSWNEQIPFGPDVKIAWIPVRGEQETRLEFFDI